MPSDDLSLFFETTSPFGLLFVLIPWSPICVLSDSCWLQILSIPSCGTLINIFKIVLNLGQILKSYPLKRSTIFTLKHHLSFYLFSTASGFVLFLEGKQLVWYIVRKEFHFLPTYCSGFLGVEKEVRNNVQVAFRMTYILSVLFVRLIIIVPADTSGSPLGSRIRDKHSEHWSQNPEPPAMAAHGCSAFS